MAPGIRYHKEPPTLRRLPFYAHDQAIKRSPPVPYKRSPLAVRRPDRYRLRLSGPVEELDPIVASDLFDSLHGLNLPLILEIAASDREISLGLISKASHADQVLRALRGSAPRLDVDLADCPPFSAARRLVTSFAQGDRWDIAPLRDIRDFARIDPLNQILESFLPLRTGEAVDIHLLISPLSRERLAQAEQQLYFNLHPLLAFLMRVPRGPYPRFEPRLQRSLEERLYTQPCFEMLGLISLRGTDQTALRSRAASLSAVFANRFNGGYGGLNINEWRWSSGPSLSPTVWHPDEPWLIATAGEAAAMWHWPSDRVAVPGIRFLKRPVITVPIEVTRARGLLLGTHHQRGEDVPIHLPYQDLHAGHLVIPAGRTGVGKSTLLNRLIEGLAASPGIPSLVLLDAHGDLSLAVATRSIPPEREPHTVLWEPGDPDYCVGLPLFERPHGVPIDVFIQMTFGAFRLVFREGWSASRMEDLVFNLTATLCLLPHTTLMDAARLLTDGPFRRRAVARLVDPASLEFWSDYEQLSEGARREMIRPVLTRLRKLYRSPTVRNVLCRTDGLDLGQLIDRGAILLISLAGPSIQAEADLLGELILTRLHLELLGRLDRPPEQRRRTYLVVDESQRYQGASLPVLLSEGRKLSATLILATQYLSGWGESLAEGVLGNAGTLICFRCGPTDSRRLAASLRPFTPDQLEDLDRYAAVVKLQIDGATMPAFDIKTLPLDTPEDPRVLDRIRTQTRARYARPRRQVEEELGAVGPTTDILDVYDIEEE